MSGKSSQDPKKDYYLILGVLPAASQAEVTSAYHVLAREYHPDVGRGDAESVAKFKLINEAYEVLSDEQKRREYDRRRQSSWAQRRSRRARNSNSFAFGWRGQNGFSRPPSSGDTKSPPPDDVEVELPVRPEEARYGGDCEFLLKLSQPCRRCGGEGVLAGAHQCGRCHGTGRVTEHRRLRVHLPRGVRAATVLRVPEEGRRRGAARGDLLLRIKIQPYC